MADSGRIRLVCGGMATLVCFHAHPDDEALTTGGTMAKYAAKGHRVVVVIATNGEVGEVPDDLGDESLELRRRRETECSAAALGVARIVWLGYRDSGMTGWDDNRHLDAFMSVDTDRAARTLADILEAEQATVLTLYDWHGNYGHPDHVKVHHVGRRAAELAGTPYVYEATTNRDVIRAVAEMGRAAGLEGDDFDPDGPADDGNPFGTPDAEITTAIDVSAYLGVKRESIRCHASQVSDTSIFLMMPDEAFAALMGTEWFIRVDMRPPERESDLAGMA